uniref:Uncharacterized protein n=1 Tax=Megaselia scalaris TaxID=36166 RepID=T1GZJ5_MEGSC
MDKSTYHCDTVTIRKAVSEVKSVTLDSGDNGVYSFHDQCSPFPFLRERSNDQSFAFLIFLKDTQFGLSGCSSTLQQNKFCHIFCSRGALGHT